MVRQKQEYEATISRRMDVLEHKVDRKILCLISSYDSHTVSLVQEVILVQLATITKLQKQQEQQPITLQRKLQLWNDLAPGYKRTSTVCINYGLNMNLGLEATSQRKNSPREKEGHVNLYTRYGKYIGTKFLKWLAPDGIILRPVMPSRSFMV